MAAGDGAAVTGAQTGMSATNAAGAIGKNQGVKPGDILGAIAGESGMPGRMVGSIDMYDKYTFVEVPREHADVVLQAMKDVKIKGKSVHMEKANRK